MQTTTLFNLPIIRTPQAVVVAELTQLLLNTVSSSQPSPQPHRTQLVFTPNPEQVVLSHRDRQFQQLLQQADYLLPDGIGLVWASRVLALLHPRSSVLPIAERVAGVDVVTQLMQVARQHKQTVLIIGGRDYVGSFEGEAYEDETSLKQLNEYLFWTEGYQDKREILPVEEAALASLIKKLRPSLVFIALGAPDQESWLVSHRRLLSQSEVRIGMAVGGSFDFIFHKIRRAPQRWQNFGLEWLWRLIQQPWRKRRQLQLLTFIGLVLRELILPQHR